jgi:nitric oxide synthase-interacting protein
MENLLFQRQEIKRFQDELKKMKKEEEESESLRDEQVKERAIRDFEGAQLGLVIKRNGNEIVERKGLKRKFELDEDELLRIAKEDREKAKKALMEEKVDLMNVN